MKLLVFDLTKVRFLKRLIGISRLIVEILNDQNLFTESNLANRFSGYVQFCSGGNFSERAEAARLCGKSNHLKETGLGTVALHKAEGQLCIYQQGKPFLLMVICFILV